MIPQNRYFDNSNRQTAKMTRQIGIFLLLQFLEAYFENDSENFVENYEYKEMCMYNKRRIKIKKVINIFFDTGCLIGQ